MKLLRNSVVILIACLGIAPTAHAQWFRLFPQAALKKSAPLAFPIRQALTETALANAALSQASTVLAQTNFVKDILRNDALPEVYMPQIDYAQRVYKYIDFLRGTRNSLSVEIVQKLTDMLNQVTLMSPVTRQVWISTLQAPYLSEEKYPLLLKQMRQYYGFGTEDDVEVLAKAGKLIDSPTIQLNVKLYEDFTTRLEKFVEVNHHFPRELAGVASVEEMSLAREYQLLQFVKDINNLGPIRPYMQRIEKIAKSVK